MTIYFDTCALNRFTDDQSQARVSDESFAVEQILEQVAAAKVRWLTSQFVRDELARNPNAIKRAQSLPLLDMASGELPFTPDIPARASELQLQGYGLFDSLHLAMCEAHAVDTLLTVDDRLIRRAARPPQSSTLEVLNPIDWLMRNSTWRPKP